jgi:hypothetical protein
MPVLEKMHNVSVFKFEKLDKLTEIEIGSSCFVENIKISPKYDTS